MDEKMEAEVMKELKAIRKDVIFIKKHIDPDCILTPEEEERYEESLREFHEGKAVPLQEFEQELQ